MAPLALPPRAETAIDALQDTLSGAGMETFARWSQPDAATRGLVANGRVEAIGMRRSLLFRHIMLPQVARFPLAGLGTVWQLTLKDIALISVIGFVSARAVERSASAR